MKASLRRCWKSFPTKIVPGEIATYRDSIFLEKSGSW